MLQRRYRLRSRHDFNRVYRGGHAARSPLLVIRSLPNGLDINRAAVVVSTKVAKRAVIRNRARRRLIAQLGQLWPQLAPGHDLVISLSGDPGTLSTPELMAQLRSCLKRLRLLR